MKNKTLYVTPRDGCCYLSPALGKEEVSAGTFDGLLDEQHSLGDWISILRSAPGLKEDLEEVSDSKSTEHPHTLLDRLVQLETMIPRMVTRIDSLETELEGSVNV